MKIASLVARILLGLIFLFAGGAGFYFYTHGLPAIPGLAGDFQNVYFKSGYVLYVDSLYIAIALLLLANRYVPLALVVLAGIIVNILIFHLTMMLSGILPGIVVTVLWFLVAWPLRERFAPLLAAKSESLR